MHSSAVQYQQKLESLMVKVFPKLRTMFTSKINRCANLMCSPSIAAFRTFATAEASANTSTVDQRDVARFGTLSTNWWDSNSPVLPLMSLNAIRVPFIRDGLIATRQIPSDKIKTTRVLGGIKILEIGCGGGFLTENLARLHANVVGIDASKEIIKEAERHACLCSPELVERIQYKAETIEHYVNDHLNEYDAVVMSEVLEHVENVAKFIAAAIDTLKPGGSVFITVPNRTALMYLTGICLAENVLSLVPKGTHEWNKFIAPLELQRVLESLNCTTVLVNGFVYEFWRNTWRWIPSNSFSYALQAIKRKDDSHHKISTGST